MDKEKIVLINEDRIEDQEIHFATVFEPRVGDLKPHLNLESGLIESYEFTDEGIWVQI